MLRNTCSLQHSITTTIYLCIDIIPQVPQVSEYLLYLKPSIVIQITWHRDHCQNTHDGHHGEHFEEGETSFSLFGLSFIHSPIDPLLPVLSHCSRSVGIRLHCRRARLRSVYCRFPLVRLRLVGALCGFRRVPTALSFAFVRLRLVGALRGFRCLPTVPIFGSFPVTIAPLLADASMWCSNAFVMSSTCLIAAATLGAASPA